MHKHGGDIYRNRVQLDFSSNINLMGIPKSVVEAAKKGVELSYRYPDTESHRLKEAISKAEKISEKDIVCGNGAADLIFSLVLAVKPKKALLCAPTFYEYEQALNVVDCEITYHALTEENRFLLKEDFLEKITKDTDIVFLCNPNNPTGTLIEPLLLERILNKCGICDCLLVLDECFMDFVECADKYSVKKLYGNSKNLFVLKAFTKLYAMPGLRLGYGFSRDLDLIEKINRVSQPWRVSVPAELAGIAALKEEEYVKESLRILNEEKVFVIEELKKLRIAVYGSKANYIFFKAEKDLYSQCLKRGMLIRDCSNYRGLEKGYYRIVVKTHEENKLLIEVLKEVLKWQSQL